MQDEQAGPRQPEAGEPRVDAGPRPETGEPRVDAAIAALDELSELPVAEHATVFEQVHQQLREVLGELDTWAEGAGAAAAGEAPPRPGPAR